MIIYILTHHKHLPNTYLNIIYNKIDKIMNKRSYESAVRQIKEVSSMDQFKIIYTLLA